MGLTDELEALRRAGSVRAKSTALSATVSERGFTTLDTPETEAERRKQKKLRDRQSLLDAQKAMHSGGKGAAYGDLNLLYRKLMMEQREKKKAAERNLHSWRGKGGKGGKNKDGEDIGDDDEEEEYYPPIPEDEASMNAAALDLLPEHVVSALKAKYETDDAASALSQALKEESEHEGDGKGTLATLMEVTSPRAGDAAPYDEEGAEKEEGEKDEKASLDPVAEEKKEPEEEGEAKEEKPEPVEEEKPEPVAEEEPEEAKKDPKEEGEAKSEPVEEVREKIEQLSIEDEENKPKEEEPKSLPPTPTKPDLSYIPNSQRISETKRFYNLHSQEYVDNISPRLALTPTAHRDAFLTKIHTQLHLEENEPLTLIDLGCGFGRDTQYFTSKGHHVMGVDFSVEMLHHAKKLAPKAHYLNVDMCSLASLLVDESVDGVWANASLFHLPNVNAALVLHELHNKVKPGGVLFLSLKIGDRGEVFEADERYAVGEDAPFLDNSQEEDGVIPDDTRRKLYSYYTIEEAKELVVGSGWEVMEMGEDDRRERSDYVEHSMVYVFATRK